VVLVCIEAVYISGVFVHSKEWICNSEIKVVIQNCPILLISFSYIQAMLTGLQQIRGKEIVTKQEIGHVLALEQRELSDIKANLYTSTLTFSGHGCKMPPMRSIAIAKVF
jgi:hypothetical protein